MRKGKLNPEFQVRLAEKESSGRGWRISPLSVKWQVIIIIIIINITAVLKQCNQETQEAQLLLTKAPKDDLHFTTPEGSSDAHHIPSIVYLHHCI